MEKHKHICRAIALQNPTVKDGFRRVASFYVDLHAEKIGEITGSVVEVEASLFDTRMETIKSGDIVNLAMDNCDDWFILSIESRRIDRQVQYYTDVILKAIKAQIPEDEVIGEEAICKACISSFIRVTKN